jgi:PPP family 3-phenylpropionic acid transporter
VIWFLAATFLMMASHAVLYTFFSIYLDQHGYSKTSIGAIWAIGVIAEIVLFSKQQRLFARFGAVNLLGFSMICAAIRFALIAASGGALAVLVLAQCLHSITFGVHHSASMTLLHRWFPPDLQARAQAVFIGAGYGLGGLSGAMLASRVWQSDGLAGWSGPTSSFALAAVEAGVGAVCVWMVKKEDSRCVANG